MILYIIYHVTAHRHVHVLMRDEKEERSKQGQTNNKGKATQHTHGSHFSYVHVIYSKPVHQVHYYEM